MFRNVHFSKLYLLISIIQIYVIIFVFFFLCLLFTIEVVKGLEISTFKFNSSLV